MDLKVVGNGKLIKAYSSQKPKFGSKACWYDSSVIIDGKKVDIFWECMRGQNYFFEWDYKWYRIPFHIGKNFLLKSNLEEINYNEEWKVVDDRKIKYSPIDV